MCFTEEGKRGRTKSIYITLLTIILYSISLIYYELYHELFSFRKFDKVLRHRRSIIHTQRVE